MGSGAGVTVSAPHGVWGCVTAKPSRIPRIISPLPAAGRGVGGGALQISQIDVIPIRAPRKEVVRSAAGANTVSASEFGIVRILTDNGLEGLGEISLTFPQVGFSLCHAARHWLAPKLIGLDPLALPQAMRVIDSALVGELSAPYLRAAFEMAL